MKSSRADHYCLSRKSQKVIWGYFYVTAVLSFHMSKFPTTNNCMFSESLSVHYLHVFNESALKKKIFQYVFLSLCFWTVFVLFVFSPSKSIYRPCEWGYFWTVRTFWLITTTSKRCLRAKRNPGFIQPGCYLTTFNFHTWRLTPQGHC